MGIRIFMYAVDRPALEGLLDRSIADTFRCYAAHGTDPRRGLHGFRDWPSGPIYHAIPGRGIHCGDRWHSPEEAPLEHDPFLAQPVRQYLAESSTLILKIFLGCFSQCAGVEGIHCITESHRRWWIGSFFHA